VIRELLQVVVISLLIAMALVLWGVYFGGCRG
jgi:hypothetical protein